ncbi:hypothetical protein Fcan01_18896 [Folsomia candida]|uniref:Uncharacterized protein n=1 Tax=Folsomia candida TaxID=158441 RepID=A0A226DQ95_FOLCA|nr:hypothetical protein Fcan01_18896 [Folsomia candida]
MDSTSTKELQDQVKTHEAKIQELEEALNTKSLNEAGNEGKRDWSLGLSEDEDEADKLLGNLRSKDDDGNMCQIEELLADIEKGADLGPEISQNVAESFLKTISPLTGQQQSQQALSVGLSALSIITSQVLIRKSEIPNEVVSSIVKLAIDAANVLGDQSQQVNSNRKMDLKRYLNPDYAGICTSQVPQSEWLFGSELSESLKESKTTSSLMRNTSVRGGDRFHPYNRPGTSRQNYSSLNYQRPFRPRFQPRGNGQYRPSYRQSQPSLGWRNSQPYRPSRN